ncbi:MAG: hypothetical protein M0R70_12830 [Nitrospirae bacterium]|nr:hypothetical protein [Nitrospirota bacterium]
MKTSTLDTKGLYRIAKRLTMLATLIKELVPQVIDEMIKLDNNHKNIVAAHRAHTTMARSASLRAGSEGRKAK